MTVGASDLTTVAFVKQWADITGDNDDALFQSLVTAISTFPSITVRFRLVFLDISGSCPFGKIRNTSFLSSISMHILDWSGL